MLFRSMYNVHPFHKFFASEVDISPPSAAKPSILLVYIDPISISLPFGVRVSSRRNVIDGTRNLYHVTIIVATIPRVPIMTSISMMTVSYVQIPLP